MKRLSKAKDLSHHSVPGDPGLCNCSVRRISVAIMEDLKPQTPQLVLEEGSQERCTVTPRGEVAPGNTPPLPSLCSLYTGNKKRLSHTNIHHPPNNPTACKLCAAPSTASLCAHQKGYDEKGNLKC